MAYFNPLLISLDYARQHRRLETAETDDDALLLQFIQEASADFIAGLQRIPIPYLDTKSFSNGNVSGLSLKLRDDLLAVTSISDGNGGSVSASVYNLRPDNRYPKNVVELESSSGSYWLATYPEDRITVTGTWGYVPHYANGAWKARTTLGANVSDTTALTVQLTSAAGIAVGDYLKVDNEVFGYNVSLATNTFTVDERGALGTTAATHTSGATVYVYQQLPDIKMAVREMVVYMYKAKDRVGGRVTVYEGGVVTVDDLDPSVERTRKRHMFKYMPRAV